MNNKGKTKLTGWGVVGLIAIGIVVAGLFGYGPAVGLFSAAGAPGTADQPIVIEGGRVAASTTLTAGPVQDKYAPTTSMANENHTIIVNGIVKGTYADAATLTVAPGDEVSGFYALTSSAYYAKEFTPFTVGDTGAAQTADPNLGDHNELCSMANLTSTSYDDNDAVLTDDGNGGNISKGNGDIFTAYVKLKGVRNKCYSPEAPALLVIEYNTSLTDDIDVSLDGVAMVETSVPAQYTLAGVARSAKAFEVPSFMSNQERKFAIDVALDANNGGTPQQITGQTYDADYYRNSDTGAYEIGYEDEDDADVGLASAKFNLFEVV